MFGFNAVRSILFFLSMAAFNTLIALSPQSLAYGDNTPLIKQVQNQNTQAILELIAANEDINGTDISGSTPLLYATHSANLEIVQSLLDAGADPNIANNYSMAPVHEAAQLGDFNLLEALLDAGALVDTPLSKSETPLMLLSRTSAIEAVSLLISRGANVNVTETWQGQTPLMYAAAHNRPTVVKALIQAGAELNTTTTLNHLPERIFAARFNVEFPKGGMTAVLLAARQGATEALSTLIEEGADLEMKTPEGFSPLVLALLNQHYDTAMTLIDAGVDLNGGALYTTVDARNRVHFMGPKIKPSGNTTELQLLTAMLAKNINFLDTPPLPLPDRESAFGSNFDAPKDTALLRAARSADLQSMQLLIKAGADAKHKRSDGFNTMLAVSTGPEIPPIFVLDKEIPEQTAAIKALTFLLAQGVNINSSDNAGATSLHVAAKRNFVSVVNFLIDSGADINQADQLGLTALDYALGRSPVLFGSPPLAPDAAAALQKFGAIEGESANEIKNAIKNEVKNEMKSEIESNINDSGVSPQ